MTIAFSVFIFARANFPDSHWTNLKSGQLFLAIKLSPCIMCVQYRRGAQYRGGVQYRGGIS